MLATLQWAGGSPGLAKALEQIERDPVCVEARTAIQEAAEAPTVLDTACLEYADFVGFVVYRQYAQLVKARRGSLSDEMEAFIVERGRRAVTSYERMLASMTRFAKLMTPLNVLPVLDQHIAALASEPSVNPMFQMVRDEFRNIGLPDDLIGAVTAEIELHRGNVFRVQGANGTFTGLLEKVHERLPKLKESQRTLEEHGLPTIEGACSSGNEAGAAAAQSGAVIAGMIALCALLCFL